MRWVAGTCPWTRLTPVPLQYPYLAEAISTDVLIIGGGITGALAAYHMARAGMQVALVEGNLISFNSTRSSTAILQYEIDTNLIGLRGLYGLEQAVRAFRLCEEAVADIGRIVTTLDDDCGFESVPCLYYSDSPGDVGLMREEFALRQQSGFAVTFAEGGLPFPCAAGIYSTRGAGVIDPYRFTHALLRDAAEHGARIYENTKVAQIHPEVVTENGFRIRADRVVVATGYAARNHIKQRTALFSRTFTIMTRPIAEVAGWPERCIIRDNGTPYTYLRPGPGGRILIGGEDLDVGSADSHVATLSDDDPLSDRQYGRLLERLNGLFPDLRLTEQEIECGFSGIFADTKDSLPYIGAYDPMPGCYFIMGYGANGILYDQIGGRLLCDLFQGRPAPDLDLFRFDR